jgi:hypothetical protein
VNLLGIPLITASLAYQYILITLPGFFFYVQYGILNFYCNG